MARIRSIKPELWTDDEFTECSLSARLLFIALWNFATDHGVLPDKPRQLKMQCLPADTIDVDPLITELIEHDFLIRRHAPNGDKVLVIRTFDKNQVINRKTPGRWGNPDHWDPDSGPTHGGLTEDSLSTQPRMGRDNSEGIADASHLPRQTHQGAVDKSVDEKRSKVINTIVAQRILDSPTKAQHPSGYRRTVIADVTRAHSAEIDRIAAQFPDAPISVIASAVESGNTRPLANFVPQCPAETVAHLTAEQRNQILTDNGGAKVVNIRKGTA